MTVEAPRSCPGLQRVLREAGGTHTGQAATSVECGNTHSQTAHYSKIVFFIREVNLIIIKVTSVQVVFTASLVVCLNFLILCS